MIACQFSLYPLGVESLGPLIDKALAALRARGLDVQTGPMSTMVTGETAAVFEGLQRAFEAAGGEGHVVMTITVSNACPV
jgi:uncharacterized protein YqgV (UPF0045/DUF77 family)